MLKETLENLIKNSSSLITIQEIAIKILNNQRISVNEACELYHHAPLSMLGMLAFNIKQQKSGDKVFFNRNFHIEPTNICVNNCRFCSYKKPQGDTQAWEMTMDEILHKVSQYKDSGATECHIVGGVHPDRDINYYGTLIKEVKKIIPGIVVKAFTAVEIDYMIKKAGISIEDGLKRLKECGLESIPGGGAEIFDETLRNKICPEKTSSQRWLEIHKTAHQLDIKTNATILYGHIETIEQRFEHLNRLRLLQDETQGFNCFIPLKYRHENNSMSQIGETPLIDDLKTYAISRIFLDNFPHIKAYWVMSGLETTKLALQYGADDIDGTVNNSTKIYSMAGVSGKPTMTVEQIVDAIKQVNLIAVERDTFYNEIKIYND
ncbi:MAG: aminofutalosine synthase MqnE [Bacteroidales bacterium]|nr:aminofutalosine synthase MqnE [Bacteroidales bacterium]